MHAIFRHIYMDQYMPYLKRKNTKQDYITKYDHKRPAKKCCFHKQRIQSKGPNRTRVLTKDEHFLISLDFIRILPTKNKHGFKCVLKFKMSCHRLHFCHMNEIGYWIVSLGVGKTFSRTF